MHKIYHAQNLPVHDRFKHWIDFTNQHVCTVEQYLIEDGDFHASLDGANVGDIALSRVRMCNIRTSATPRTTRLLGEKADKLIVSILNKGTIGVEQNDHSSMYSSGEVMVSDAARTWEMEMRANVDLTVLEVPRQRLESMLGPARQFTGLVAGSNLPTTMLARSFFRKLAHLSSDLAADAADRMSSIGIDLLVASIAERMAQETPKQLQPTLTIQRAKSYIESNLGEVGLDPEEIAAASGVSVRYLHALFSDHGRNIGDWIWQRRLEMAAFRLSSPDHARQPLGMLAHGCGFASQAHFSRRFRERYGMTPSEYRHQALTTLAGHGQAS